MSDDPKGSLLRARLARSQREIFNTDQVKNALRPGRLVFGDVQRAQVRVFANRHDDCGKIGARKLELVPRAAAINRVRSCTCGHESEQLDSRNDNLASETHIHVCPRFAPPLVVIPGIEPALVFLPERERKW
jgi:hypothetical protein